MKQALRLLRNPFNLILLLLALFFAGIVARQTAGYLWRQTYPKAEATVLQVRTRSFVGTGGRATRGRTLYRYRYKLSYTWQGEEKLVFFTPETSYYYHRGQQITVLLTKEAPHKFHQINHPYPLFSMLGGVLLSGLMLLVLRNLQKKQKESPFHRQGANPPLERQLHTARWQKTRKRSPPP